MRGTSTYALCFGGSNIVLQGYVDLYMESDKDRKKSTTGYAFTVGGTSVSWISKLQKVVALSTIEEEYVVSTEASKMMIWLQRFMRIWERSRRIIGCTVTTRVPFILQINHPSSLRLNDPVNFHRVTYKELH
jgi:hypothetical protein